MNTRLFTEKLLSINNGGSWKQNLDEIIIDICQTIGVSISQRDHVYLEHMSLLCIPRVCKSKLRDTIHQEESRRKESGNY